MKMKNLRENLAAVALTATIGTFMGGIYHQECVEDLDEGPNVVRLEKSISKLEAELNTPVTKEQIVSGGIDYFNSIKIQYKGTVMARRQLEGEHKRAVSKIRSSDEYQSHIAWRDSLFQIALFLALGDTVGAGIYGRLDRKRRKRKVVKEAIQG